MRKTPNLEGMLGVTEFALLKQLCRRRIFDLLAEQRITGAIKVLGVWQIPVNAEIQPRKARTAAR